MTAQPDADLLPPLPAPPRPITAHAKRQAWMELPVRIAAVIAVGVLIVVLSVGIRGIAQGVKDRELIKTGTRVTASLDWMEGAHRAADRSVPRKVRLSYLLPTDPPGSERRKIEGFLSPMPGQLTSGETKIDLYVNPDDQTDWTDRVDPPSWLRAMTVPLLLSPLALATIGLTLLQRARVLKLYRDGTAMRANVVDTQKSALIPSGKIIKVSFPEAGGGVLGSVRPNRLGPVPARGEQVGVIVDNSAKPRRVLFADAYAG